MMHTGIKKKLEQIEDIWRYYIWKHKFFHREIKFTIEVRSNYFADILFYFDDSLEILDSFSPSDNRTDHIRDMIAFLQMIYIQQDFIEESLVLFGCNVGKGDLKKDPNYSKNREIRNELIGHPIRRVTEGGKRKFVSSTIIPLDSFDPGMISYMRYSIKNDQYTSERLSYSIKEILSRHENFLIEHLDTIISKLKSILKKFKKRLCEIKKTTTSRASLQSLVTFLSHNFSSIFEENYLFSLKYIYEVERKKEEHPRYKNLIELFYSEVTVSLDATISAIKEELGEDNKTPTHITNPNHNKKQNKSLSKMISEENFEFHSGVLMKEYPNDKEILNEIQNMSENIENKLEYYCSYYYLCKLIEG